MLISLVEYLKPAKALTRPHKGIVVDNEDPDKLGRVKCSVAGLLEAEKADLPWIMPFNISPNKFDAPQVDDELIIEFKYGDIYTPFYTGYWHNAENHNADFDDDYPNSMGISVDGLLMKYNKKKKEGKIEAGDFKLTLKDDGSVEMDLKDFVALISGKLELKSDGDVTVEGGGSGKFLGKGGTDVGDGGSVTNVAGSLVNLAGGGNPVAVLTSAVMAQAGNMGAPVSGKVLEGSSKVFAPK